LESVNVNDLLKMAVERGASDLHLKVGSFPMLSASNVDEFKLKMKGVTTTGEAAGASNALPASKSGA
jgi:Tfp pilus assembly pilus retraction ATPase PilT